MCLIVRCLHACGAPFANRIGRVAQRVWADAHRFLPSSHPPPLFAAFGWSYELRGWNQGLRCGWRADLLRLASVKGRALPTVLNAVEAEEEAAPSIKGKRKALSLASEASYKRKSTAEEEDPGWKGSLMWMKLEEEFKANADSIVGKLASAVTMDRKNGTVTRGRFVYSIQKLQAKLGKDICLPVAIGTSRITQLNCVFCPHKGEAGHEIKGEYHFFPKGWHANFNSDSNRTVVQDEYLHPDFQ